MKIRASFPLIPAVAAVMLGAGCSHKSPTETTGSTHVVVRASESADANGVDVQLLRVENDSRCAVNVQCVWAGNATAVITVRTPETKVGVLLAQQFVNTNIDPRYVDVSGYRVRLDSLKPAPVAGQTIEQKDYVAYLSITKN
ncbi:MAG TPA: hypothetical protein VE967_04765 [Gemmatimonadaceae bacterium]|nr:hypothetical protein [Gemmatimonadaceae bacterium]